MGFFAIAVKPADLWGKNYAIPVGGFFLKLFLYITFSEKVVIKKIQYFLLCLRVEKMSESHVTLQHFPRQSFYLSTETI